MKKHIEEFTEFKIENLQNLIGGEIISFNTGANAGYPQGDHRDITYDEYGIGAEDGFGGGTCLFQTSDYGISPTTAYAGVYYKP
jgi:hypothetical protein